jgi:SAM-dependent methyltransferase
MSGPGRTRFAVSGPMLERRLIAWSGHHVPRASGVKVAPALTVNTEALRSMDAINRRAWSDASTVRWFRKLEGWTDEGERAALGSVADEVRGGPILDLGVGGGRTVPLLRAISRDYVALDYTPELVAACKLKYPDVNVQDGDARDLSRFADESFSLVVFSFNGIDAVSADDRMTILREVHRVLRKGGMFLFSAHNRAGPGHGERFNLGVYRTRNPVKLLGRLIAALVYAGRAVRNHARYSKLNYEGAGYSIMNAAAHHHGVLLHYTSLDHQLEQIEAAGFQPDPVVFGNVEARRLAPGEDTGAMWWFHFLARK